MMKIDPREVIEFKTKTWEHKSNYTTKTWDDFVCWRELDDESGELRDEPPQHVHELLRGHVKPYFDFEHDFDDQHVYDRDHGSLIANAQMAIMEHFKEHFKDPKPGSRSVMLFTACGYSEEKKKWRASARFILKGCGYFEKPEHMKALVAELNVKCPGFDEQVYSSGRTMRMPYCTKEKDLKRKLERAAITAKDLVIKTFEETEIGRFGEDYLDYAITFCLKEKVCLTTDEMREKAVAVPLQNNYRSKHLTLPEINAYIGALAPGRAETRTNWRIGVLAIQQLAQYQGLDLSEQAQKFAMTGGEKYCRTSTKDLYESPEAHNFTFNLIIGWARKDNPSIENEIKRLKGERVYEDTYAEDRVELLGKNPSEDDISAWMLGHLRLVKESGEGDWYERTHAGWKYINNRSNFPFSTPTTSSTYLVETGEKFKNGKAKMGKKAFKDLLVELKDTPAFKNTCIAAKAGFYPYFREQIPDVLNHFSGWKYSTDPVEYDDDLKLFSAHMDIICGKDTVEYVWKWMASLIQKPQRKMPNLVFYSADQGAGKDTIWKFVGEALGYTQALTDAKLIVGEFNGAVENTLLTILNECKSDGKSIADEEVFKSRSTEVNVAIRKLYKEARQGHNWSKYVLMTNNRDAIKLSASDRRNVMINCGCEKAGDHEYFKTIYERLDNETFYGKLLGYLANLDLEDFDPLEIPKTKFREEAKEMSASSAIKHIRSICEGEHEEIDISESPMLLSKKELFEHYRAYCQAEGMQYGKIKETYLRDIEVLGLTAARYRNVRCLGGEIDPRARGIKLDIDELLLAFRKHFKNKDFKFIEA